MAYMLQVAGIGAGLAGVWLLFGLGWFLLGGAIPAVAVGVVLEREAIRQSGK